MITRRPLPGISFQTVPLPPADSLPRMDVAAFVGFASSGPIGVPVALADAVDFEQIFGADQVLARDEVRGIDHRAYLGPAVRAFFRNGGTRCWVVRVAGENAAANQCPVPGLVQFTGSDAAAACLRARSEGAWSDGVAVGAVLERTPLQGAAWDWAAAPPVLTLSRRSREPLLPGDLLRLRYPGATLYLTVESAHTDGALWRVRGAERWFTPAPTLPPLAALTVLGTDREGRQSPLQVLKHEPPGAAGGVHRFYVPLAESPGPGSLLELRQGAALRVLMPVIASDDATPQEAGRPDWTGGPLIALIGRDLLRPVAIVAGRQAAAGSVPVAERLTLSLWVRTGAAAIRQLNGLGLTPQHARFVGAMPTDRERFTPPPGWSPESSLPMAVGPWLDLFDARFPLAGPAAPADLFLPLGLWDQAEPAAFALPLPAAASVPERNGLDQFAPELFFDPDLARLDSTTLPAAVTHRSEILGEPLTGLHALWPLDEVTVVAVPDALHPGWEPVAHAPLPPLPAPVLSLNPSDITWTSVPNATQYRLQWAHDPLFAGPVMELVQTGTAMARPEPAPCRQILFYRVRAERLGAPGPWSNTERVVVQQSDFDDCDGEHLAAPHQLTLTPAGDGRQMLRWEGADALYRVETAASPDFADGVELAAVNDFTLAVFPVAEGATFYRVRAEAGGAVSPWSATVTYFISRTTTVWTLLQPDAGRWPEFIRVQSALCRLARARGDIVAILALPHELRAAELNEYASRLAAALAGVDEAALSYAALYHPWLWVREGAEEPRLVPPDGALTGRITARARERGAWIAPANEALSGVIALAPEQGDDAWSQFDAEQANLVQQASRGFLVKSEDTLSRDPDLRPLHVRRLMILLRRLALREGAALVFEPNGDRFRRMVQRRFERMLADLWSRGAFAGRIASDGFQVAVDDSVNPAQSVDQGRLIVELRVAPARALTFLRVRLMQTRAAGAFTEEG